VESVAWVAERKDMLSALFGFLSLWFYCRYANGQKSANSETPQPGLAFLKSCSYWLACVSFVLGLMSKPMLVTWPFVLLLLDYWPLGRMAGIRWLAGETESAGGRPLTLKQLLVEKIPFFAFTVAACLVTYVVQQQEGAVWETNSLLARWENTPISYCRYLLKLIWPADFAAFYPHPGFWPLNWVLWAVMVLTGLSIFFWRQRRHYPFLIMGWLWFIGTLVPVIGLVQVGAQSIADRYMYIPSVGVLVMAVWGFYQFARPWERVVRALCMAGWLAVFLCCGLTRQEIRHWKDSVTLFQHSLAVTHDNEVARNNLGLAFLNLGQTNAAVTQFQAAVHLDSACVEAHANLGNIFFKEGLTNDALNEFRAAVESKTNNSHAGQSG
jgi:hypothetical protein